MKINTPFEVMPITNVDLEQRSSYQLPEKLSTNARTGDLEYCIHRNEILNDLDHRITDIEEKSRKAIRSFKNHCDKIHISYRTAVSSHNAIVAAVSERRVMSKTYSVYPWIRFSLDFMTKIPLAIGLSTPVLMTTGALHADKMSLETTVGILLLSLFVGMIASSIRDVVKKGQENERKEKMKIDPLRGINKPSLVADRYNRIKIRFEVYVRLKLKELHDQHATITKCLSSDHPPKQKHIKMANKYLKLFNHTESNLIKFFHLPDIPSESEMKASFERRIWAEWIHEKSLHCKDSDKAGGHERLLRKHDNGGNSSISFKRDRRSNVYFPVEVVQRLQELGIFEIWKKRPGAKSATPHAKLTTPSECPVVTESYLKSIGENMNEHIRAWLFSQSYRIEPEVFKRVKAWVDKERSKSHAFTQLKTYLKQASPHDYLMYFKEDMVYHLFINANLQAINDD